MGLFKLGVVMGRSNFVKSLRFPVLFLLFVIAFLVNLIVPDPLPFVDELVLGLGALLLSRLRRRSEKSGSTQTPPK